jgi:hypothetical protein
MPLWYGGGALRFSWDGKTIYTTALNLGQKSLFAVDVQTGNVKTIIREGYSSSPAVAGKRIVFCLNNYKSPTELYSVNPDGGELRALTEVNKERAAEARMGDYEQFHFEGWNKETKNIRLFFLSTAARRHLRSTVLAASRRMQGPGMLLLWWTSTALPVTASPLPILSGTTGAENHWRTCEKDWPRH